MFPSRTIRSEDKDGKIRASMAVGRADSHSYHSVSLLPLRQKPADNYGGFLPLSRLSKEILVEDGLVKEMTSQTLHANEAAAVLRAFDDARRAGWSSVDCYKAAVDAWKQRHPDQTAEYAAKHAVALVLAERGAD